MWQRFTERARRVILCGQEEAIARNSEQVSTAHLLLGLTRDEKSVGSLVLRQLGIAPADVWAATSIVIPPDETSASGEPLLTSKAKLVLKYATDEAQLARQDYIGTEHLLLAMLREASGIAFSVLSELGINSSDVRAQLTNFLSANPELAQRTMTSSLSSVEYATEIYEVLAAGKQDCRDEGSWQMEPVHLLRALCREASESARILSEAGVDIETLRAQLKK